MRMKSRCRHFLETSIDSQWKSSNIQPYCFNRIGAAQSISQKQRKQEWIKDYMHGKKSDWNHQQTRLNKCWITVPWKQVWTKWKWEFLTIAGWRRMHLRGHQEEMQGQQNWWNVPSAQRVNRPSLHRPKKPLQEQGKREAQKSLQNSERGHASESICSENFEITLLQTDNQFCALGSPYVMFNVSSFASLDVCLSNTAHEWSCEKSGEGSYAGKKEKFVSVEHAALGETWFVLKFKK